MNRNLLSPPTQEYSPLSPENSGQPAVEPDDPRVLALIDERRNAAGGLAPAPIRQRQGGSADEPTSPVAAISTERSASDPAFFRTVAHLGIQAAEALEHAHQVGIIHRDIKPSNVMITLYDGKPVPKVIDFGVANRFPARHRWTGSPSPRGSPVYRLNTAPT